MSDKSSERTRSPWLVGIVDTLVGARLIRRSAIPHRNRLAVILLDSSFETACRAFLRYRAKITLSDAHKHRDNLVNTVKAKLTDIDGAVWDSIDFYYQEIRCDFYHDSAGKTITDEAVLDYQETVEFVIDRAFEIRSGSIADAQSEKSTPAEEVPTAKRLAARAAAVTQLENRVHKVLLAVDVVSPVAVEEVNELFKREGDDLRLKKDDFTNIVARNTGSKRLFYFNKEFRRWELSGLGRFKLQQLLGGGGDAR